MAEKTHQLGETAHRAGIVTNTLLAVVKILGGVLSGSPSLLADGYHSLSDTATNVVAWLSWRWAQRPADDDHHYGHGKAEAAASFFLGLVLTFAGLAVLWEAMTSTAPSYEGAEAAVALGVALISIGANLWLSRVTGRAAATLESHSLRAVTRDNLSDALSSGLVVLGVLASLAGWGGIELVAAAVIGILIARMGLSSLREGLDVLMDRVPDMGLRERVRGVAVGVEGVRGVQRVDVHPLGDRLRVDMEISVDGEQTVRKGHAIAHEVERAVTLEEPGVVEVAVHVNPAPE